MADTHTFETAATLAREWRTETTLVRLQREAHWSDPVCHNKAPLLLSGIWCTLRHVSADLAIIR